MSKKSNSGIKMTYDEKNLITDDFARDVDNYYNLYAPAWGGYAHASTLDHPENKEDFDYNQVTVNSFERNNFWDQRQYNWLQKHPGFKGDKQLTNKLSRYRFKVLLYYHRSENKTERQWAADRLFVECSGFIKKFLSDRGINEPELYPEVLQFCYIALLEHIHEYEDIDKKSGLPNIDIYQPTTFMTTQLKSGIANAFKELNGETRHFAEQRYKLQKAISAAAKDGIEDPTAAELVIYLGANWTVHKVENAMMWLMVGMSCSLESLAVDLPDKGLQPDEYTIEKEKMDALTNAINELDDDEKEYLCMKYGIGKYEGYPSMKFTDMAAKVAGDDESQQDKALRNIKKKVASAIRKMLNNSVLSAYYKEKRIYRSESITRNQALSLNNFIMNIDNEDEIIEGKKPESNMPI